MRLMLACACAVPCSPRERHRASKQWGIQQRKLCWRSLCLPWLWRKALRVCFPLFTLLSLSSRSDMAATLPVFLLPVLLMKRYTALTGDSHKIEMSGQQQAAVRLVASKHLPLTTLECKVTRQDKPLVLVWRPACII